MQSRLESFIESSTNMAVGFGIALLSNVFILPLYGLHPTLSDSTWITVWFIAISLTRTYILRRIFNYKLIRKNNGKTND